MYWCIILGPVFSTIRLSRNTFRINCVCITDGTWRRGPRMGSWSFSWCRFSFRRAFVSPAPSKGNLLERRYHFSYIPSVCRDQRPVFRSGVREAPSRPSPGKCTSAATSRGRGESSEGRKGKSPSRCETGPRILSWSICFEIRAVASTASAEMVRLSPYRAAALPELSGRQIYGPLEIIFQGIIMHQIRGTCERA